MIKILGIGNALEDISVQLDSEELFLELQLSKGRMTLIDEVHEVHEEISYTGNGNPTRRRGVVSGIKKI